MTSALLALVLVVIPQGPRAASNWTDVMALPQGAQIKFAVKGGEIEGTFVAANPDELVIHLKRGNFSVDRINVRRLDLRSPESNRSRNIGRGAGIGLAVGLLRSSVGCGRCSVFGGSLVTIQSTLIGTLVGATASAVKWKTIYRRAK